jgi:hypothetical protein
MVDEYKVNGMEKCEDCGYCTDNHLIHMDDGKCYCARHFLGHILHDNFQEIKTKRMNAEI